MPPYMLLYHYLAAVLVAYSRADGTITMSGGQVSTVPDDQDPLFIGYYIAPDSSTSQYHPTMPAYNSPRPSPAPDSLKWRMENLR